MAVLLRWALAPVLGRNYTFALAYPTTVVVTRLFGIGPGIVAVLAAGAGMAALTDDRDPARLGVYLALSGLAVFVTGAWGRARAQAIENASRRAREEQVSAQLRAIVESSEDAVISTDLEGYIQSWNRSAEAIFGFTAAEAVDHPLSLLLPPTRPDQETEVVERVRRGVHVKQFETERVRKDGRTIQVSLTISPIFSPSGSLIGVSHIARDISERKAFEEQLRQTQKLESLGVLAGGLAHDFNNLLTDIMGNASLVMEELPAGSTAHGRVQEVIQAGERVAELIRQMLAYAGKGRFVIEKLDLSALINDLVPLLRTSVPRKVEFGLRLEENPPPIEADRTQIQQLVMNLAINAGEADRERPRGGVDYGLFAPRRGRAGIDLAGGGYRLRNERRDQGPYFRSLLHHQVHRARPRAGGGNGDHPGASRNHIRRFHPRTGQQIHGGAAVRRGRGTGRAQRIRSIGVVSRLERSHSSGAKYPSLQCAFSLGRPRGGTTLISTRW